MSETRIFLTRESMNEAIPFKAFPMRGKLRQPPHSHEYLQMWYVKSGHCTHYINHYFYEYSRFGLFIIPPYASHYIVIEDEDAELICCEFSERFINEALMNENRSGLFDFAYLEPFFLTENLIDTAYRISAENAPILERLFVDILFEFRHQRKYSYLFIKADLLKLLQPSLRSMKAACRTSRARCLRATTTRLTAPRRISTHTMPRSSIWRMSAGSP